MKINQAKMRLETLLSRDPKQIIQDNCSLFDRIAYPYEKSLVLFGAGALGLRTLEGLRKEGIEPLAFIDNNPKLWSTQLEGLPVMPVQEAIERFGEQVTFVVTIFNGAKVRSQLKELNLFRVVPFSFLYWKYNHIFFPYCGLSLPNPIFEQAEKVLDCLTVWSDEASQLEYVAQLEWRCSLDFNTLPPHAPAQDTYFPPDLVELGSDEFFVDCGAFDGDSCRAFMSRVSAYKNILALEADPVNYENLQKLTQMLPGNHRERFSAIQVAVGKKNGRISFNITGTVVSSAGEGGTTEVEVRNLDDILRGKRPTFIKMDIEGAEPDALEGGKEVIGESLPILSICSYHEQDHLWKIPLLIRSLSDHYHIYLRRHAEECWELVTYAIPDIRSDHH